MKNLIEDIKNKLELNGAKINKLFEKNIKDLKLVAELDIVATLDIKYEQYEKLKNASKDISISEEELREIINILNFLDDKIKIMHLVNDKVIRGGGKIDKNTMTYLLKKDSEKKVQTAVINIYIDDVGNPLKLNHVLGKEKDD